MLVEDIKAFPRKKIQKRLYGCKQYKDQPENETEKLVKYRKKYYKMRRKHSLIIIKNYCFKK